MPQDNIVPTTDLITEGLAPNSTSAQSSDPLVKATATIESILSQTTTNPATRAAQIAAAKSAYIAEKFGVR